VGGYFRWIPLDDPDNLPLKQGGILSDVKITEEGIILVMKNISHKHFQMKMDECFLFQKLTAQQKILLSAIDHVSS
jgi:hypothetical protein